MGALPSYPKVSLTDAVKGTNSDTLSVSVTHFRPTIYYAATYEVELRIDLSERPARNRYSCHHAWRLTSYIPSRLVVSMLFGRSTAKLYEGYFIRLVKSCTPAHLGDRISNLRGQLSSGSVRVFRAIDLNPLLR